MLLSKDGLRYNKEIIEIFPEAYIVRGNGDIVYTENGWQKLFQTGVVGQLIPDKKITGLAESEGELFVVYEDCIESEFGRRYCMNVKKNLQISKDLYQLRVSNGSGVHFFGMFGTTYMFDGLVLTFQSYVCISGPQKYSVHTINRDGSYVSYELDEESCSTHWSKNAKMTKLGDSIFRVKVELIVATYYIVDFNTGFASKTRKDAIDIHENGQNMVIEYRDEPYFDLVPLGTNQRITVSELDNIKNTKSARKL